MAKPNWNAVLVEPVPYLFEKLKKNYPSHPRLRFENVAINDGTKQVFYFVNIKEEEKLKNFPHWYDQLGSFNRANILNHLDGTLEPYIEEMEIIGFTLDQLFTKNGVKNLKLLHHRYRRLRLEDFVST